MSYSIKFDFTGDKLEDLREDIWPITLAKRIIKAEFGMGPNVDNGEDIRYVTESASTFVELLRIAINHSAGGWWTADPMPKESHVYHLPTRGGKYTNCSDWEEVKERKIKEVKRLMPPPLYPEGTVLVPVDRPASRPDDRDLAAFDGSGKRVPGTTEGAKKGRQEAP